MAVKTKKTPSKALPESYKQHRNVFLPILLVTVCMGIALLTSVINNFFYPLGKEPLSPLVIQIVSLLIPASLLFMIIYPEGSTLKNFKSIGFHRIRAEHVFPIIFTSLFLITSSLMINLCLGGFYAVADGFTILGSFTAGVGEYSTTYPYIAIIYAIAPAMIEEFIFRGMIQTELSKKDDFFAICLSSLISAAFSFTLGGLPAAILCALTYCFIRSLTGSLFASIILHTVFNLYAVFLQTNVAKYFLSSQNNLLLIIIIVIAWLVSSALFFSEMARVYRARAEKIKKGEATSTLPTVSFKSLGKALKEIFAFRPTLVTTIIGGVFFIAIVAINYFA